MSLREKFSHMKEYAFVELVDVNYFKHFLKSFFMQNIDSLNNKYPNIFDNQSSVNELKYCLCLFIVTLKVASQSIQF